MIKLQKKLKKQKIYYREGNFQAAKIDIFLGGINS